MAWSSFHPFKYLQQVSEDQAFQLMKVCWWVPGWLTPSEVTPQPSHLGSCCTTLLCTWWVSLLAHLFMTSGLELDKALSLSACSPSAILCWMLVRVYLRRGNTACNSWNEKQIIRKHRKVLLLSFSVLSNKLLIMYLFCKKQLDTISLVLSPWQEKEKHPVLPNWIQPSDVFFRT